LYGAIDFQDQPWEHGMLQERAEETKMTLRYFCSVIIIVSRWFLQSHQLMSMLLAKSRQVLGCM
jgi:hypothetical protein